MKEVIQRPMLCQIMSEGPRMQENSMVFHLRLTRKQKQNRGEPRRTEENRGEAEKCTEENRGEPRRTEESRPYQALVSIAEKWQLQQYFGKSALKFH